MFFFFNSLKKQKVNTKFNKQLCQASKQHGQQRHQAEQLTHQQRAARLSPADRTQPGRKRGHLPETEPERWARHVHLSTPVILQVPQDPNRAKAEAEAPPLADRIRYPPPSQINHVRRPWRPLPRWHGPPPTLPTKIQPHPASSSPALSPPSKTCASPPKFAFSVHFAWVGGMYLPTCLPIVRACFPLDLRTEGDGFGSFSSLACLHGWRFFKPGALTSPRAPVAEH